MANIETKINANQDPMSQFVRITELDLVNNALLLLGAAPINSFEDVGDAVTLVKTRFPFLRDAMLASAHWSFAKKRAQLVELTDESATAQTPLWEYAHAYILPDDCLRVLETDLDRVAWKREGRYIVTDSDSVAILYLARIVDVNLWPPDVHEAFSAHLAADIAYSLTKKEELQKQMFDLAEFRMSEARANDGQEGTQDAFKATTLIDVR
jgi:hypothetical protein